MKHVAFSAYWIATALVVAGNVSWIHEVYVRPRSEIRELLGHVPKGIRVVGYYNGVGVHGGTILWNLDLPNAAATELHARCTGPGFIREFGRYIQEVQAADQKKTPVAQPNGCLVATRNVPGGYDSEVVVQGRLLQLLVAM
jgi:hypothetical protein